MSETENLIKKRQRKFNIPWHYIIVSIVLFGLAMLFPYSNDDWAWGSTTGLERLAIFFKDYNGRYLGNLLVIALTRSNILKSVVMSATYVSIAYLIQHIVSKNNNAIFYLGLSSILLADKVLLRQTIVNTSGFTNYTFCILLVLIYINHLNNQENGKPENKWPVNILLLLLGICTCLFMEHISIYAFLLAAFVVLYQKLKLHKITKSNVFYLIGTTIGCLCMFTNGAYLHVLKGDDFYRAAPVSFMDKVYKAGSNLFLTMSPNTISSQLFVNLIIGALLIVLCAKFTVRSEANQKKKNFAFVSMIIIALVNTYFVAIQLDNKWSPLGKHTTGFTGVLAFVYFIFIAIVIGILVSDKRVKTRLLFALASIAVLTAPLLILSPVTPRCSLPMYIFYALFMCELLAYTISPIVSERFNSICKALCITVFCFAVLYLTSIYSYVTYKNSERLTDIKDQLDNGSRTVCIEKNKYEQYVWKNYPVSRIWETRFLDFYGFSTDIEIEVLDEDNPAYDAYKTIIPKDTNKLMIVAHPDDELMWGGGHLLHDKYLVVCITNGDDSVRRVEFEKTMKQTGDVGIILNFPDRTNGEKSDWSTCSDSIRNALSNIIDERDWEVIVTHNPQGEYGHIQHKMTSKIVTGLVEDKSKLVYFGKYYPEKLINEEKASGKIATDKALIALNNTDAQKKLDIFKKNYVSQKRTHFYHMFGYENFITYNNWNK